MLSINAPICALVLPRQYDLWKQQALVYFEDFDLSELDACEPAPGLPLGSIVASAP